MKLVLIGAYGYTARLICEQLQENQIAFCAAGRDLQKLKSLKKNFTCIESTRLIDLQLEKDLSPFVNEFDTFINCAGPFTEESIHLVSAIAKAKNKLYLDISGEIGFVKESRERNHSIAIENKSTLIHACAFESLVVDLAARILQDKLGDIDSIHSFYTFKNSRPSPGTRMTMKLSKFRHLYAVAEGEWRLIDSVRDKKNLVVNGEGVTAVPYPLPEIAFSLWNFSIKNSMSYLLLSKEEALFAGGEMKVTDSIQGELDALKQRKKEGPPQEKRQLQLCEVIVQASTLEGKVDTLKLSGQDMYRMTAKSIVKTILLLKIGENNKHGVISPAVFYQGRETEMLNELGVSSECIPELNLS